MKVHELITKLQECDKPDAEAIITGCVGDIREGDEFENPIVSVFFNDTTGPVYIDISEAL